MRWAFALAVGLACAPLGVNAADDEVHGKIADAETGAPIEGAVIVARWESRIDEGRYRERRGYVRSEPLEVLEVVTGSDGRYAIPGPDRKLAAHAGADGHADPLLAVFKPGYEPLAVRNAEWDGKTIPLKRWTGPLKDYADRIARFQVGALGWMDDGAWKPMPRMVRALHEEKRRLGRDGESIEGVARMPGRSGIGRLVEEGTGQRIAATYPKPIVSVAWTLRRSDGSATRRYVRQEFTGFSGEGPDAFVVSPWRTDAPPLPAGWDLAYDVPPEVTVYATGYHRVVQAHWPEAGMTVALRKVESGRGAVLAELREWRRDFDAELARSGADREAAIVGERELLVRLITECRTLVPDARAGICFDPHSDVVLAVEHSFASPGARVAGQGGISGVAGAGFPSARPAMQARPPVQAHFSIVPVSPRAAGSRP